METKVRRRRKPGSQQAQGRTAGANRKSPGASGKSARRSAPARRRRPTEEPTVRPPKEEIPEVTYTMPQPVSRHTFLLRLLSVVAAVAALMMCLSLFFRVEQVLVSGADKYTPWMVKEASGVNQGDSLLSISDARISGNIISALPYVKEVRVGIKLPGTVNIEIVELDMTYAIQAVDGSWWLIAADGRVVEQIETTAASGYTRILGVQADGPRADQKVQAAQDQTNQPDPTIASDENGVTLPPVTQITGADRMEAVLTILQALEDNGVIGQIASIDVTNLNDISMEYGQRLTIVLGTEENLAYKIAYMAQAISQIEEYQTGELDVSFKYSEKALLNPEH